MREQVSDVIGGGGRGGWTSKHRSGGTGGAFLPSYVPTRTTAPDLPPGPPARERNERRFLQPPPTPPPLHTLSLSFLQMGARHEFFSPICPAGLYLYRRFHFHFPFPLSPYPMGQLAAASTPDEQSAGSVGRALPFFNVTSFCGVLTAAI